MSPRQLLRHPGWLVVLAGTLALLLVWAATCSAPEARTLPPPSSTSSTEPEPTTTTVDRSRLVLQPVPGRTTTTITTTGDAILSGVVLGPEGNVPGAVVRIERLVGDIVQTNEVRARDDGTWVLEGLPGGRIRVRAYLPPSLAMLEPDIFFLPDGETRDLRLQVRSHQGLDVRAGTTPQAPTVGDAVNVAVRVAERVVDDRGVATTRPVPGLAVRMRWSGWTRIAGADDDADDGDDRFDDPFDGRFDDDGTDTDADDDLVETTDDDGVAVFTFRCDRATSVTATALIGAGDDEQTFPLEVPACGPEPTTTTTTAPAGDTPDASSTTTTEDG